MSEPLQKAILDLNMQNRHKACGKGNILQQGHNSRVEGKTGYYFQRPLCGVKTLTSPLNVFTKLTTYRYGKPMYPTIQCETRTLEKTG